jgi:hypothetical protein
MSNFYMLGLKTADNIVRLCKYQGGSFYITATHSTTLSNNQWYQLRVEVLNSTVTAYIDCQQVMQITDIEMKPTGFLGVRTYNCRTYFDDIRVYAAPGS